MASGSDLDQTGALIGQPCSSNSRSLAPFPFPMTPKTPGECPLIIANPDVNSQILAFHLDYSFAAAVEYCCEPVKTSDDRNQPCLPPHGDVECSPHHHAAGRRGIQVRVLTAPSILYSTSTHSLSMASLETVAAPGSPPELSHSLSSKKSSSYNSSSLSDSAPHELAHFEDISLDDLPNAVANDVFANKNSYVRRQSSNGSLKRGLVSTSSANKEGSRNGGSARQQHPPLRLLTDTSNGKRITSSTMKPRPQPTKSNTTARPSPFGTPSPRKRVPSSPNPYLPSLIPPGKRSRSISPSPTQPFNTSPQSLYSPNLSTRRPSASGGGALAAFRRSSWQPGNRAGRKTVKELEDEYDDNDEELPEDAVVWNVPLSPRPPHDRSDRESSPSKSEISAPSPRDSGMSMTRTSSDISAAIATGTPAGLGLSMPSKVPPQPQPQPGSLPRSISMNVPLEMGGLRGAHTKSWDAAMSDLSAEARMLTAALEAFASERDKVREDAVQAGSRLSSTFQLSDKRTSSTSMIELPPLRKGDIMIDPLPISKEKEAVLTRTRPSWLPPKSQKEERRHLKEYARMMASVKEAEKKKGERVQRELEKRDREMGSLNRIWEQHVLPRWDRCINEPRTRELWWRGVSPRSRGDVWALAVGNDLGLSEKSFEAALERAKECERRLLAMEEDRREQEREWRWFEDIQRDVASAFPELKIFQSDGGPLHDAFVEVLMAYAFYRGDVGYVSGVHVSTFHCFYHGLRVKRTS